MRYGELLAMVQHLPAGTDVVLTYKKDAAPEVLSLLQLLARDIVRAHPNEGYRIFKIAASGQWAWERDRNRMTIQVAPRFDHEYFTELTYRHLEQVEVRRCS